MAKKLIMMRNIIKRYYIGQPNELQILNGIDLDIHEGEFVAIVGASGSGKSTLMNMIGALDRPTEGTYFLNDTDVSRLNDKQLSAIRNKEIGFVFQTFNLIPRANALKNVELPMLYAGMKKKERQDRAMDLLRLVDMQDRYTHKPNELSGGQKQRVAIARLDSKTGHMVMDIFHKLHEKEGKTVVLITHSPELAAETERIITISDGSIISDTGVTEKIKPESVFPGTEVSAE